MNVAVGKVSGWFRENGFRSCTLKVQGNALLYPYPLHRTPGDIDIWVSGYPSEVIRFVRSVAPNEKESYHHIGRWHPRRGALSPLLSAEHIAQPQVAEVLCGQG